MNRTKYIATASVMAALYLVLVLAFAGISYGQIQFRVANILIGVVPLLGMPAVVGITVGVFASNVISPLGPLDLLSAIPSFVGLALIYKLRNRSVLLGLSIYTLLVSLWVSFLIFRTYEVPWVPTFAYVFVGVFLATVVGGYAVYRAAGKVMAK
ncbi:MAG: QueT transporter family protein [Nitrososphaerota archaeon]|nr:QueT transporter family protein [Nitrososphaerota archaeon]